MASLKRKTFWLISVFFVYFPEFFLCQKPITDNKRHDVYIAGFFPYGRGVENSDTGRGVMPSVKLALDHVNEHTKILPNYRLHMWWNDTMCNAAVGVKAFFDMMHSGPHKLMLFGAACTHVTDPIAKASKHWHLTQLSYADTHPMFTKENFPNFFRIVPSENAFNSPRLSLLREFNWTIVGTIYQNEPRYSLAHNRLVAELDIRQYQVLETQSFTNEVNTALMKLKEKDTRVILGNFNERWARNIFCSAYKLEMYGKKYQWIIMGTYSHNWWQKSLDNDYNCTLEELELALEQTILTDLLPLSTSPEITFAGITPDEYKQEYDSRRGPEYSRFHGYTYDGIWAVALAIQNVADKLKQLRRDITVIDFKYRDPLWEKLFLDALNNTSFEGVTGPVRFYNNERKASILLKQFQTGEEIKVGEYTAATDHLDLSLGAPLKWIGRHPPKDRTLVIIEHTRVNKTAFVILATLAICGIFIAAFFLAFNIKYRNQRYIKMSSPQLNNLIIIGCMITYTSIIFLGLDSGLSSIEAFPYICTARAWTLMAGFSLAFGAMFSKTWRVHSIFTDVKLNKKVIKDYQLFMVVGVLLFVDIVIMTTWQFADPFYRETKRLEPRISAHPHEDIQIIPENEYCSSHQMTIFIGSIYAYKGLLMIFGAFLAWETRHVSIPALNDSRYVGFSVYNVVIMCVLGAAVALALVDHQDEMFLIIGFFILFCTTITLCLVFVPKMLELRKDQSGAHIDKRIRATLRPMSKTRRDSSVSEIETKIKDLKDLNTKYRKTLVDRETELQLLVNQLGNEAKEILEKTDDSITDTNRLSVPLLRKEPPSATETSDITSLCSLSSQDYNTLHHSDSQKRKKHALSESPKRDSSNKPIPEQNECDSDKTANGSIANKTADALAVDSNYNSVAAKQNVNECQKSEVKCDSSVKKVTNKTPTHERKQSRTIEKIDSIDIQEKRRSSIKSNEIIEEETSTCHRRVSITRTTPKKKIEGGTHVVAKSELWDTPGSGPHRCAKSHQKVAQNRSTPSQDEEDIHVHRTVSERSRTSSQKEKREKSPQKQKNGQEMSTNICNQQCNKLGYFQSTPNVASMKTSATHPPKREKSMYNASSENELLDREILPIFQKLLTERNKSQQNIGYQFGRSCPNISIKCDIVEYL